MIEVEYIMKALQSKLDDAEERNSELVEALRKFVEWHGGCHENDCSLDDTCSCKGKPINDAVNAVLAKNGGKPSQVLEGPKSTEWWMR